MAYGRRTFRGRRRPVRWLEDQSFDNRTVITTVVGVMPTFTLQYFANNELVLEKGPAFNIGAGLSARGSAFEQFNETGLRIERIIGDLFLGLRQSSDITDAAQATNVLVRMGLCVLQTDDNGAFLNEADYSLGEGSNALTEQQKYMDGQSRRWLWRRQWVLSNYYSITPANVVAWSTYGGGQSQGNPNETLGPTQNVGYQSLFTGPHVDFKPRVTLGKNDQLVWRFYAKDVSGNNASQFTFDLLRPMRTLVSKSTNARRMKS